MGIILKMFEQENPIKCVPGRFRQVYPEYLTDVNVLLCPGFASAEIGYEILYPASNETYWKDLYYQVEGVDPDEENVGYYQSVIPIIIEKEGCSGGGGRNVLFVDGHVKFIRDENWDADMGPYLEHAYN